MKSIYNTKTGSRSALSPNKQMIKKLILSAVILTAVQAPLHAQAKDTANVTMPSWWFGAAAGANFNFYRGTTQQLTSDQMAPAAFHNGNGVGLYVAPLVEFHRPGKMWGAMLQVGYDNRKATFDQVLSPCNCPADLSAKLSYITIEPSLRFAPFKSNLYIYAGPRIAFNRDKSFIFQQHTNPAFPEQETSPEVRGDFSDVNDMLISGQVGAGYDIFLSPKNKMTQFVVSPFVSFHPYFGQSPRTVESWNVTTLRAGVALKLGRGHKTSADDAATTPDKAGDASADTKFAVNSPENIPVARRVRETFPLRNYVFFDIGSTKIPKRYVLLEKSQVKDFKEDQLEVFAPKELSGRSKRQMIAYYNILNIVGDRMQKNPSSSITLVGSSEKGPEDAKVMAGSVKQYLVDVFAIDASRINIEGRDKPKSPSEQPGATRELELLREGDRRVSIESASPALLMEFQSGPDAPLKPVEIVAVQEAPIDSYVSFSVEGSKEPLTTWSLEITDEKGTVQNFGPYTKEKVSIPGKSILGTRPEGDYKVKMTGKTKSGKTVTKETTAHMVLWTPPENEEGMRYSVIFGFNESKSSDIYEKYLTEVVTPKIPKGGTIIIHGHTDIIGDDAYNQTMSMSRANDVKRILESSLAKAGRKDVKFEVHGFGEDEGTAPFENKYPEERFYNRTVVIDIIPAK